MEKAKDPRFAPWRRHTLGVLSLLLLTSAAGLAMYGEGASNSTYVALCMRVGLLLGALWLALPQLLGIFTRFPPWMIGGTLILAVLVVTHPRSLLYAIPILGVLFVFHILGWFTRPLSDKQRKRPANDRPPAPPSDES